MKMLVGIMLIILGVGVFLPENFRFNPAGKMDRAGGFLSGFLGGLLGNQGAIRSAYLLNYVLEKEVFIGTSTVLALVIDAARIPVYLSSQRPLFRHIPWEFALLIVCALAGTLVGKQVLKRFSSGAFRKVVAGFVIVIGIGFILPVLR